MLHVAYKENNTYAYKILVRNPEGKTVFEDQVI
jgi:hypothetical protein